MRYYKAVEVPHKPFIQWHLWADSEDELISLELENDPLIIREDYLPDFQFGVSPMKVVDGELVNRTPQEMLDFEAEYIKDLKISESANKIIEVNKGQFQYDGKTFPMYEAARLLYSCIERTPANYKVLHSGGIYDLMQANNTAFLDAYYSKLLLLTQP